MKNGLTRLVTLCLTIILVFVSVTFAYIESSIPTSTRDHSDEHFEGGVYRGDGGIHYTSYMYTGEISCVYL
ncbi:hypothetical protein Ccel_2359 [Ruminiclostridium cellulolyticum H10]|uniref:Uncharacterized protein n=1 Tax=Ruminiclostridium cellulolyticum (strain ATCC 35319 / DSM 5812 / JCM 6584 / H10) TaxID=394503 RepID=B8I5F7_RUMCH|nr:hypothetical protein Ccel_2359 [Ruminiclostridium cellulolyticum H10]